MEYVSKVVTVEDNFDPDDEEGRTFTAREYRCTVKEIDMQCLTMGNWNYHPSGSVIYLYHDYEVMSYFDVLDGNKLPSAVVDVIVELHKREPVF